MKYIKNYINIWNKILQMLLNYSKTFPFANNNVVLEEMHSKSNGWEQETICSWPQWLWRDCVLGESVWFSLCGRLETMHKWGVRECFRWNNIQVRTSGYKACFCNLDITFLSSRKWESLSHKTRKVIERKEQLQKRQTRRFMYPELLVLLLPG